MEGASEDRKERLVGEGWIDAYVKYTQGQESPEAFHKWTAVAVIAGALRRNVWVNKGYYVLYPNLYTVLVAPTGRCRKSTASKIGVEILQKVDGMRILHEKTTPEGLIAYLGGAEQYKLNVGPNSKNGNKEAAVKDAKTITMSVKQNSNVFIWAPELSVFLGSQNYNAGLPEMLTSLYEGQDSWEYTTRTKGQIHLYNVNVNLFGASTPEWLGKALGVDMHGGGFTGRIIPVYQRDSDKRIAWPVVSREQEMVKISLARDLHRISSLQGEFKVDAKTRDYYEKWYKTNDNKIGDSEFSGYYERKPDHVLKVAMILSVSRDDSMVIDINMIDEALEMLEDLEPSMPEAFAFVGSTNEAKISRKIVDAIRESGGTITHKSLYAKIGHLTRNTKEFSENMKSLQEAGKIEAVRDEKATIKYTINASPVVRLIPKEKPKKIKMAIASAMKEKEPEEKKTSLEGLLAKTLIDIEKGAPRDDKE